MRVLILLLALNLSGCGGLAGQLFIMQEKFEADCNAKGWVFDMHELTCEPVVAVVPPEIPEPFKGWGWTDEEYDALVQCEGAGGKMGSSKNCRMP